MSATDDLLADLLGRNSTLFATYEGWSNAQIMLLAGAIDDPESFNASGGKTGALGYYPIVNVSGDTVYVPCIARLQAMAAGGVDPEVLNNLLSAQVTAATAQVAAAQEQVTLAVQAKADAETAHAAAEVARVAAEIAAVVIEIAPEGAPYANAFLDEDDYSAGGWLDDGTFAPEAFVAPGESITADALDPNVTARLFTAPIGNAFEVMGEGTAAGLFDDDDYMSYQVHGNGKIEFFDVELPANLIDRIAATAATNAQVEIGIEFLPEGSPYSYVFIDDDDFMAVALDPAGKDALGTAVAKLGTDQLLEDASYLIVPTLDADGNQQLRSQSKITGNKMLLTSSGEDARAPSLDSGYLTYRSGSVYRRVPVAGGTTRQITPTPGMYYMWGDSLTDQIGNSPPYWNYAATQRAGSVWLGGGISGQGTPTISARQGGRPAKLTVTSDTIPASGPVTVTAFSVRLLTTATYTNAQTLPGTLETPSGSVHGVLYKDTSDVYTFTRSVDGAPIACPAQTTFIPDAAREGRHATAVLWMGRNDGYAFSSLTQPAIADCDAYMETIVRQMLIFGVTTKSDGSENPGSTGYNAIVAHNAAMAMAYGSITFAPDHTVLNADGRFVDVRRLVIDHGLALVGLTPTTDDSAAIANDLLPPSLMRPASSEPVLLHFGVYGNLAIGMILDKILTAKGW